MTGHLHLVFAARDGRTYLSEQSFRAPMHLSKPYWDGHHLIVNAVNPTAGFFAGDVVDVAIRVTDGARAVLTSPSASRVYQARPGRLPTLLRQHIAVESGAWLDAIPEILIPQAGARYAQETLLDIHEGGQLFFLESIAPGRVASGEIFAFESLRWTTRLTVAGRLAALERYRLTPAGGSLHSLRLHFPASYHATGYAVSPRLPEDDSLLKAIAALSTPDILIAASPIAKNALAFKILARDSITLRQAISGLRSLIYETLAVPQPALRKL